MMNILGTLRNKLQWNFNWISNIFIQENVFENVVCEMASISYRPQCVNIARKCIKYLAKINFSIITTPGLILLSIYDRVYVNQCVNTLRPRQNGRHFPDDIFKWFFLNENVWILINISLKFVPMGPINNIPTLVQVMAWRWPGDKPLSELMMAYRLPTHICVTRPQWVKCSNWNKFECSSLKNGLKNDPYVKISNWVSMHIFDDLQDPLPVSWIGHTGRIISVKLKLIWLMVTPVDRRTDRRTDKMCHTIIRLTFFEHIKIGLFL